MHQNKNLQQSPWQRRRQQRRQQDEQLATERKQALDASAPRLRNLFIFVQVFLLYVVVSIFGVDDRDLLDPNSTVKVPLFNIGLPTFYFFLLSPVLIALLHINLLLHNQAYQDKLRHWRDGAPKAQLDQLAPNFFDIAFLAQDRWQRQLVRASLWLLLYFWPPAALCLALFWFADYQNPWVTLGHFGLLIISYGASIYFSRKHNRANNKRQSLWRWMQNSLLVALPLWGCYFFTVVILLTWISHELSDPWFESNLLYQPNIDAPSFIYQKLDSATIDLAKAYESNTSRDELIKSYSQPLDLRERSLRYANLSSSFLPRVRLADADLAGANLRQASLQGAELILTLLPGADLRGARLQNAILLWAQLQDANLLRAQLQGADLWHAQLRDTNLSSARLQGADFRGAQLQDTDLRLARLHDTDLSFTQLQGADLFAAQLQGANLSSAQLQDANFSFARLQGANFHSAQLQDTDLKLARLQGADLSLAQLQGANLLGAQLQGASLSSAQLHGANLWQARLQGADLSLAQLQGANLLGAQLQGASLSSAQLQGSYLWQAQLQGANLSNTQLHGAYLWQTQLQGAWSDPDTVSNLNLTANRRKNLLLFEGFTSDLSKVSKQSLSSAKAESIIAELEEVKQLDGLSDDHQGSIDEAIARIRDAVDKPWALEGSGAITGVLTQEMIDEILEQWDD